MSGLTFVLTGVLDSMEREEAAQVIRDHGGRITVNLSRKTTYIVVGEDSGLAKLAKADELGVQPLSEDELLNLIRTKSGLPAIVEVIKEIPAQNGNDIGAEQKKKISKVLNKSVKSEWSPAKLPKLKIKDEQEETMSKRSEIDTDIVKKESQKKKNVQVEIGIVKWESSKDLDIDRPTTAYHRDIASVENQAWVEKYKPTCVKQIIGQQGAANNVAK